MLSHSQQCHHFSFNIYRSLFVYRYTVPHSNSSFYHLPVLFFHFKNFRQSPWILSSLKFSTVHPRLFDSSDNGCYCCRFQAAEWAGCLKDLQQHRGGRRVSNWVHNQNSLSCNLWSQLYLRASFRHWTLPITTLGFLFSRPAIKHSCW